MGASLSSPFYVDEGEFFMQASNILRAPFVNVSVAFQTPVSVDSTSFTGFDWTQAYPGTSKDGHGAYLTVAKEMHLDEAVVQNATTVLSSLTFDTPGSMMSGGVPLPMDPSWYLCRHIFVSTKPEVKKAVDGGAKCSFLSQDCQADLKTSLTKNWGTAADDKVMCSTFMYTPIPKSCFDSFGYARQDVIGFDSSTLANHTLAPLHTSKVQGQYSWRIGTGYHSPGNAPAYQEAANRTYLVATVWGYSRKVDAKSAKLPEVSFGCLSPSTTFVPPPPPPPPPPSSTTTRITPTATPTRVPNNVAYYDDFGTGNMVERKVFDGSFNADSKALVAGSSFGGKALLDSSFSDFMFEADVTLSASATGNANAGLVFRAANPASGPDAYNGYYAGIGLDGAVILGRAANSWTGLGTAKADINANQVHHLKVRALGSAIDVYVDDMSLPKISVTDGTFGSGMDGARVFLTGATFDNVQISPLVFSDDFSSGKLDRWSVYDGSFDATWKMLGSAPLPSGKALISGTLFKDFIYEADISLSTSSTGNAGLIFRTSNPHSGPDGYYGYYAGIGDGFVVLGRADNNWNQLSSVTADVKAGPLHHLLVRAKGDLISVYVNDMNTPKITVKDATYVTGLNGVRLYQTGLAVDNVKIYAI